MPDLADFQTFWADFLDKSQARDSDFLRKTLPATIADDHLAFLLEMRANLAQEIGTRGVDPVFEEGTTAEGVSMVTASFGWEEDDGSFKMEMPFYHHDGQWVSYDPNDPEA